MILSDAEKRNTAYHEAGHALVAAMLPNADPLHKVTIIPRGMALGVTMQLPIDDKHSYNKDYLLAQLAILMAGRIAEEKFMHHMTTGAGNDIERATDLARKMVCEWGMSELGPAELRQEGRADLPRPRNRAASRLQRRDRHPHRRAGEEAGAGRLRHRRRHHRGALRGPGHDRRNAAGTRDSGWHRSDADHQGPDPAASASIRRTPGDHTQQVLRPEGGRRVPGSRKRSVRSRRDSRDFRSTCSTSTALCWTPPRISAARSSRCSIPIPARPSPSIT